MLPTWGGDQHPFLQLGVSFFLRALGRAAAVGADRNAGGAAGGHGGDKAMDGAGQASGTLRPAEGQGISPPG